MRFAQSVRKKYTQKCQRKNFERSENSYGHESVQALWQDDAGEVALNYRIYLLHAVCDFLHSVLNFTINFLSPSISRNPPL